MDMVKSVHYGIVVCCLLQPWKSLISFSDVFLFLDFDMSYRVAPKMIRRSLRIDIYKYFKMILRIAGINAQKTYPNTALLCSRT